MGGKSPGSVIGCVAPAVRPMLCLTTSDAWVVNCKCVYCYFSCQIRFEGSLSASTYGLP